MSDEHSPLKPAPWWFRERASVGLFAGAIWRANGFVLEEFSMRKRGTNAAEPYAGRGDLLFTLPKDQRFVAEAKWSCPSPNSGSMVQTVRDALGAAQRDLAMVQGYGDCRRLSLVFVAPRFGVRRFRNKPAVIEQALDEMLRELWQDQHLSLV